MTDQPPIVVLFDLGGVLVRFGGVSALGELAGIADEEELWRRWLSCPWVREFERGRCSADTFARGVVADWALDVTPDAFLAAFTAWIGGPLPFAHELVTDVSRTVPVGCLSNTNALHWDELIRRWADLVASFEWRFTSHELGMIKPDREIFQHVLEVLDVPADRVLFVDDNVLNVESARAVGLRAHRAKGVAQARDVLHRSGVLT